MIYSFLWPFLNPSQYSCALTVELSQSSPDAEQYVLTNSSCSHVNISTSLTHHHVAATWRRRRLNVMLLVICILYYELWTWFMIAERDCDEMDEATHFWLIPWFGSLHRPLGCATVKTYVPTKIQRRLLLSVAFMHSVPVNGPSSTHWSCVSLRAVECRLIHSVPVTEATALFLWFFSNWSVVFYTLSECCHQLLSHSAPVEASKLWLCSSPKFLSLLWW